MFYRILIGMCLIGTCVYPQSGRAQERATLPAVTMAQMQLFYKEHMRAAVEDQFMRAAHPIPEVTARIASQMSIVQRTRHTYIDLQVVYGYIDNEPWKYQVTRINADPPQIRVSVLAYMNRYHRLEQQGAKDINAAFEDALIVGLIHELDHMVLDAVNGFPKDPTKADMIRAEIEAWAETSEHAIRPFAERHLPLDVSDEGVYKMWVDAGRSVTSVAWIDAVQAWHQDQAF